MLEKNASPVDHLQNEGNSNDSDEIEITEAEIETIIRQYAYGAMAVGLVPLPIVDLMGVSGVQLSLVKKLAEIYDVPFSQEMMKASIASLVGATVPTLLRLQLTSFTKFIPIIGQGLGAISMSAMAGTSTYAIGRVFNRHFIEGGTFLTFDSEKAKAFYTEMLKEGESVAKELKNQPPEKKL